MFNKNLNNRFSYSLIGKTYKPLIPEFRLIYDPKVDSEFWTTKKGAYENYKNELKKTHYFGQNRRCAYCRKRLRADAYWEDLDHIVAQSKKGNWIYYPKNLIVTCPPCNRLKNANETLTNPNASRFPLYTGGFRTFNPHFDKWEDHFVIEKGIFLKGICYKNQMESICTFNSELEIIKPSNYMLNYYYMLISCKSIGYLEYVLDFCKISIVISFDL